MSALQTGPDRSWDLPEVVARMTAAEDTLRALGAGEVDAFVVTDKDFGMRVFTLTTADRPYRMFVENMRDGAATVSERGLILYANARLAALLGRSRDEVVGCPLADFLVGGASAIPAEMLDHDGVSITVEATLIDSTGHQVPALVGISPLEVDGGQLSCLTFTDLTAQKAQEGEIALLQQMQAERLAQLQDAQALLTRQATHDALTGLPNRALLMDRIEQALAAAKRSGRCTAVFFVDIDHFKQINDNFGHAMGDRVLEAVGRQLGAVLRTSDTVARLGGDEFVVLAHDVDNQLHAVDIGQRLLERLASQGPVTDNGSPVGVSVGIAVSTAGEGTAETLLKQADIAMYLAKSQGGGRAEVFDSALGKLASQRAEARRTLEAALDQHRVTAFYQPILDLATGRAAGFEALARITAADGSIVPPSEFIPIAEDTGLIVPLGAQILGLACHEATRWSGIAAVGADVSVAVNLSSRQFESGGLPTAVRSHLRSSGIAPHRVHLELTETATIDLRPQVLSQLSSIRDLGVEIGLDDFGTGYGSLTHLRRLPLTFVKIDQSFVRGLGSSPEDERIVSAVVKLAENLGLRSIAEGVETAEQLAFLRQLGCDQVQGYLFARPMPPTDITPATFAY
jgi:diguanylate cyclase (GGDEF)-like protein/PAS domain S-box-containing protein